MLTNALSTLIWTVNLVVLRIFEPRIEIYYISDLVGRG